METDGSPPYCIIYKYGFLHVSITLHYERAFQNVCVCVCTVRVCVSVHMPALLLLLLCIWEQVCLHSDYQHSFATSLCLCVSMCLLLLSLCVCTGYECVYVHMPVCIYVHSAHTAHVFQVEFFFHSPACGRKRYSLLIKLFALSLLEPILLTSLECSTVKSSCCTSLFIFSWAACLSSWLVDNIHKFRLSKTNRRCFG